MARGRDPLRQPLHQQGIAMALQFLLIDTKGPQIDPETPVAPQDRRDQTAAAAVAETGQMAVQVDDRRGGQGFRRRSRQGQTAGGQCQAASGQDRKGRAAGHRITASSQPGSDWVIRGSQRTASNSHRAAVIRRMLLRLISSAKIVCVVRVMASPHRLGDALSFRRGRASPIQFSNH